MHAQAWFGLMARYGYAAHAEVGGIELDCLALHGVSLVQSSRCPGGPPPGEHKQRRRWHGCWLSSSLHGSAPHGQVGGGVDVDVDVLAARLLQYFFIIILAFGWDLEKKFVVVGAISSHYCCRRALP